MFTYTTNVLLSTHSGELSRIKTKNDNLLYDEKECNSKHVLNYFSVVVLSHKNSNRFDET